MAGGPIPLHVGGVPEHFNYPWHHAHEQGAFAASGVEFSWRDYPEGTGAMAADLAAGQLDAAVLLSEGAVAAISRGVPIRIIGWAVTTPLIWGIHTAPDCGVELTDIHQPVFAISRFGSGSHLMAHVLSEQQGWAEPRFEVVNNLDGAISALAAQRAELFLWERFTTQPVVDRGQMARIGQIPTPWPAFCLAVTETALEAKARAVADLWATVCEANAAMGGLDDLPERIGQRYGLQTEQVRQWLALTRWGDASSIEPEKIEAIIHRLDALDLLERPLTAADCLADQGGMPSGSAG